MRTWRRTAGALLAALVVGQFSGGQLALSAATPSPTMPVGRVDSKVLGIGIFAADYTLNIGIGAAKSDVRDDIVRGDSSFFDAGLLGALVSVLDFPTLRKNGVSDAQIKDIKSLLAAEQPSHVDSRNKLEASKDQPRVLGWTISPTQVGPVKLETGSEWARASKEPLETEAVTTAVAGATGMFDLAGGTASTYISPQSAKAHTTVGDLVLAGGKVVMHGLDWQSSQEMGKPATSSFSVKSMEVGGEIIDMTDASKVPAAIEKANKSMAGFGAEILYPTVSEDGSSVSPLGFMLVDSPALQKSIGTWYPTVAKQITDWELDQTGNIPELGLLFTVLNVVVGILTGDGGLKITIGGASADLKTEPRKVAPTTSSPSTTAPQVVGSLQAPAPETTTANTANNVSAPPKRSGAPSTPSIPTPTTPLPIADVPRDNQIAMGVRDQVVQPKTVGSTLPDTSPAAALIGGLVALLLIAGLDQIRVRRS